MAWKYLLLIACCTFADCSLAADPPQLPPPDLIPWAQEAQKQFERGNYAEAEKVYRQILTKAPENLYTLSNLGVVLFRAGKLKLSEETFKKAIAVAPGDGFSHCTLGIVYYSDGDYDDAIEQLTKAVAINPNDETARHYLSFNHSQMGYQWCLEHDYDKAIDETTKAIAIFPENGMAHYYLGIASLQKGHREAGHKEMATAAQFGYDALSPNSEEPPEAKDEIRRLLKTSDQANPAP